LIPGNAVGFVLPQALHRRHAAEPRSLREGAGVAAGVRKE